MRYIKNKIDLPCTSRAKSKPPKNIYNIKVLKLWKHQQNRLKDYSWTPIQRRGCFHQLW